MSSIPENVSQRLVAVIMAGGAGTRFWPASTEAHPKQFLTLLGELSMLQQTHARLRAVLPVDRIFVLTNQRFADLVKAQVPDLPASHVIGEPMRRDTAAAVALALVLAEKVVEDPVVGLFAADHLIQPQGDFEKTLASAAQGAVENDAIYTFGIVPTFASTAYGYLELGEDLQSPDAVPHHEVRRFVEKPDLEKAEAYLQGGRHLWNSGMFVWRASVMRAEYQRQLPLHLDNLDAAAAHFEKPDFDQHLHDAFEPLEKTSVDYGIMEGAKAIRCVRAQFEWSDLGGWLALEDHLPSDESMNLHRGRLVAAEATRNLVFCSDDEETVALFGVRDLVVVRSGKRTLVADKAHAEKLKAIVEQLEPDQR
jgi:mannose-1-phosphate guanylyltransferase